MTALQYFLREFRNAAQDSRFSAIFKGSAWVLGGRIATAILGLAAHILIARLYGAEAMGIVSMVNSFLLVATIFTVFGTNTSILRFIPEHVVNYSFTSAYRLYRKMHFMVVCGSIVAGAFFIFSSNWMALKLFSKPQFSFYLFIAAFFIVFKSLTLFNTAAIRGLQMIRLFVFIQQVPPLVNLSVLVLLTMTHWSEANPVYARLAAVLVTGLSGWLVMVFAFKKRIKTDDIVHHVPARRVFSISMPMFMTATMGLVIGQIGILMIGAFRSETEVGYFAVAVKLATLCNFVVTAINMVVAPKFSELYHSTRYDELFYVAKKAAKLIFWTTVPILLGLMVFGTLILKYVFGSEFLAAYPALVIMLVGQLVNSMAGSTTQFLNMTGRQNVLGYILLGGTVINVVINWLLIPSYGILGASAAAGISSVFLNAASLLYIRSIHGKTTGYLPFSRLLRG